MTNPAAGGEEVVRGTPTDDEQKQWLRAADEYFPAPKSLERIDGKVSLILGSIALVGSVVAGFGLLGKTDEAARRHSSLVGAVVLLLVVAIILALVANLPWIWRIPPRRIDRIERFFRRSVAVRGWLVVGAAVSFSLGVVLALVLLAVSTRDVTDPAVGLGWSRDGAATNVTGTVTASLLPPRTEIEIVVIGVESTGSETVLAHDVRHSGSTSTLTVSAVTKGNTRYHRYRVNVRVHLTDGTTRTFTQQLSA